jgi:hypothetical protein
MSEVFDGMFRRMESVEGIITPDAVREASTQMREESDDSTVENAKKLSRCFVDRVAEQQELVDQKSEELASAVSELDDLEDALDYFASTGNPLPFFRVSGRVECGRVWCVENGLRVIPNIQDKESEWYVQAS